MAVKTYGNIFFDGTKWVMDKAEPHVCIKLKSIFQKIQKTSTVPFNFEDTPENAADLLWFMDRYPMSIAAKDKERMKQSRILFVNKINTIEQILTPGYLPREVVLNAGELARPYQIVGAEFHASVNRCLIGDDLGLGKTLTGILTMLTPGALPCIVVAPSHLLSLY